MTSGQNYEQRQIFNASVTFSDFKGKKVRPVLIISCNRFNNSHQDVICCPITSEVKGFGRVICPADYELENKTLPVPQSEIKSQYPIVIHKSLLVPLKNRIKITKELAKKVVEDINEAIENK